MRDKRSLFALNITQLGHVDYQVYFMRKLWVNYLLGFSHDF